MKSGQQVTPTNKKKFMIMIPSAESCTINAIDKKNLSPSLSLPGLATQKFKMHLENKAFKTRLLSNIANRKISTDRSKNIQTLNTARGISYNTETAKSMIKEENTSELLATLGIMKGKTAREFPKSFEKLKESLTINSDSELEKYDLGSPVGRKDAQELADWVQLMLNKALSDQNEDIDKLFESAMMIYNICFYEIVRQVSVQCKERGELINMVWKAYLSLLERALRVSQVKLSCQSNDYEKEKNSIIKKYAAEISKITVEKNKANYEIEQLKKLVISKEEEISSFLNREERLCDKIEIIQKHYEAVKKEVLLLKEDNRILSTKVERAKINFEENKDGIIQYIPPEIAKVKRKKQEEINKILAQDPVLSSVSELHALDSNAFIESIGKNEENEKEIFLVPDFKDIGIDAPVVEIKNIHIQTDVTELCGESKGERKVIAEPDAPKLELQIMDIIKYSQEDADRAWIEETFREETQKHSENQQQFLVQFQKKIDQVNDLIVRMKTNIKENKNVAENYAFANTLYSSIAMAIKKVKQETPMMVEEIEVEAESESVEKIEEVPKIGRLWSIIQKVHMKKPQDLATVITQKVLNTPNHKLKKIMIKKMLLKFITQFYDIKLSRTNEPEYKHQTMSQLLLEVFNRKYGMHKVVVNKMYQLLSSCVKFKNIKRIYIFGRFLKLYSELTNQDLEVYLDLLKFMKENFGFKENQGDFAEIQYVLYDKAIEFCKVYLAEMAQEEVSSLLVSIEALKIIDQNKIPYIELDKLYDEVIERICKKRAIRMNFVKCIYEAADLNDDGFLNFQEFELLVRHISNAKLSESYYRELFNEFAQNFTGEDNEIIQALTVESFTQLTQTYQVFSTDYLQPFAQITHPNGPIGNLLEISPNIEKIINNFKWRFLKRNSWKLHKRDLDEIMDKVKGKVLNPKNPDSVWIGLRLLDEESKLICVEENLKVLMPKISVVLPIFNSIEGVS